MAPRPRPTPHRLTGAPSTLIVWASNTDALNDFFPTATPASSTPAPPIQATRRATTVSQYPGDPTPIARRSGLVNFYPDVRRSNQTTPGRTFWCETKVTGPLGKPVTKRVQFTYQGRFHDLKTAARATATLDYVLRNASGAAYDILQDETP